MAIIRILDFDTKVSG